MIQTTKAVFRLTDKEVREAIYDSFVRQLRANNISAVFSPEDIEINCLGDVELTIREEKQIE